MTEQDNPASLEQIWGSLTDTEKEACIYFAVSDWRTGVDSRYTDAMGIEPGTLSDLISRGLVETKPTWKLYQDLADGLRDQANELRERLKQNFLAKYSDDERTILEEFSRFEMIANRKDENPRFHLADQKIHNFIRDTCSEE